MKAAILSLITSTLLLGSTAFGGIWEGKIESLQTKDDGDVWLQVSELPPHNNRPAECQFVYIKRGAISDEAYKNFITTAHVAYSTRQIVKVNANEAALIYGTNPAGSSCSLSSLQMCLAEGCLTAGP